MKKYLNLLVVPAMAVLMAGCTMPWGTPAANTDTMQETQLEGTPYEGGDTMMGDESGINEEGVDGKVSPNVEVNMIATEFAYDQKEVVARVGDLVSINLTNGGAMPHDVVIDELGVKSEMLQPGGATTVQFRVDQPGTYEFYCSVGNHRAQGMVGKLIVQ